MAKKAKVDGEKVFQDLLALLGSPKPVMFIGACNALLTSEVWLLQQDGQHLKQLEDRLREKLKAMTDDEEPYVIMTLDRVVKTRGLGVR